MDATDLYTSVRSEIVSNHLLMHWITLFVAIALLLGVWLVEKRQTVLSLFLPLLALSWVAAMVRFDFFIHRQGAYLRAVEARLAQSGFPTPLWETWKTSIRATPFIMPAADAVASAVIVVPTVYMLFGPARSYFELRQWRGGKLYAWGVTIVLVLLLCFLTAIPRLARWGQ